MCWVQLQQQCAAQQQRAEAAEAELAQERSAHRRDMRRKNKELEDTQVGSSEQPLYHAALLLIEDELAASTFHRDISRCIMQRRGGDTGIYCYVVPPMQQASPLLAAVCRALRMCTTEKLCSIIEEPCEGWCGAASQEEVVQLKELVKELRMKCRGEVQHTGWSRRPRSRWAIPAPTVHALPCAPLPLLTLELPVKAASPCDCSIHGAREYLCWFSSHLLPRYAQQQLSSILSL